MIYFITGSILILFGFSHVLNEVNAVEPKIIQYFQQISNHKPLLSLFKEIWLFGRTSFALIILILLSCLNWKMGGIAAGVFLIIIGVEYLIKTLYTRNRPFAALGYISMLQRRHITNLVPGFDNLHCCRRPPSNAYSSYRIGFPGHTGKISNGSPLFNRCTGWCWNGDPERRRNCLALECI